MIIKFVSLFCASAFLLSGCTMVNSFDKKSDPVKCFGDECAPKILESASREGFDQGYVSYTDVAADYKAHGERTPMDRKVGSSGVASNLSSSIPPIIEDEFVEYEEVVSKEGDVFAEASLSEGVEGLAAGEEEASSMADGLEDPVEDWLAEEGLSLKDLLGEWSQKAGWRLVWKTNRNYTLTAGAMFRARFADAASALVRAFARAKPAPIATFYKGNRVLVVETMEDENAY